MNKPKTDKIAKRKGRGRSVIQERPTQKYSSKGSLSVLLARQLDSAKMIEHIGKGLPFSELEHLRSEIDEPLELLGRQLSISRSTLQRRKTGRRLSPQESDRVMRFWKIIRYAVKLFGNIERARAWLKFPQFGLGGAVPLEFAKTEVGAREVEDLLGRIDYGVYS